MRNLVTILSVLLLVASATVVAQPTYIAPADGSLFPGAGPLSINFSWNSVSGATSYKVKYGTTSGNYSTTLNVGNVSNYTVTSLTNGIIYYFVVVASNVSGDSPNSNERSATPQASVPSASARRCRFWLFWCECGEFPPPPRGRVRAPDIIQPRLASCSGGC